MLRIQGKSGSQRGTRHETKCWTVCSNASDPVTVCLAKLTWFPENCAGTFDLKIAWIDIMIFNVFDSEKFISSVIDLRSLLSAVRTVRVRTANLRGPIMHQLSSRCVLGNIVCRTIVEESEVLVLNSRFVCLFVDLVEAEKCLADTPCVIFRMTDVRIRKKRTNWRNI